MSTVSTNDYIYLDPNWLTNRSWDHPRDQAGKYLYYAGTFWLYLRNETLVCVLYAYNGNLTMALV